MKTTKRILCAILAALAIMTILPSALAHADADPFDPTPDYPARLGWKKDFSYREEEGQWHYESRYEEATDESIIDIGFHTMSVAGGNDIEWTALFFEVVNLNSQSPDIPVSAKLLIDGDSYDIPTLYGETGMTGMAILGENYNLLMEALAYGSAENVSVEIRSVQNSYYLILNPIRLTATLKDFCRTYMEEHFWQFTVNKDRLIGMEEGCPLYVNGEPANYLQMHKYAGNPDRYTELQKTKLAGLEPGMTADQVHAVLGQPIQSFNDETGIMDIYMVDYDSRPGVIDPFGEYGSLFQGSNIIVNYAMKDGQYVVVSSAYGCAAEGDDAVIRNAIYPIWDVLDYATALLGPAEDKSSETGHQYIWRLDGQRLRLNVDFLVVGNGVEVFTVSTGWGLENA
jgi:hypothetical protein